MSSKFKVTFTGTGQLNGPVPINKIVEYDSVIAKSFTGPKRDETILSALEVFYPGVEINPKQIGVNIQEIRPKVEKKKKSSKKSKSHKKLTPIFANPWWLFPIRIVWRIIRWFFLTIYKAIFTDLTS